MGEAYIIFQACLKKDVEDRCWWDRQTWTVAG